jgi:hypothetical protein
VVEGHATIRGGKLCQKFCILGSCLSQTSKGVLVGSKRVKYVLTLLTLPD